MTAHSASEARSVGSSPNVLEVRGVSKSYESGLASVDALKDVTLAIPRGAFMTITGPSGSGKSTLLNILGLLDRPSSGEVLLDGKPFVVTDFDEAAEIRSKAVSFIFQSFNLIPVLTLEENVRVPLVVRHDIPAEEKARRTEEWIRAVGLWEHRHHRPDQLSGGQRQRVSIARAMVTYPEVVLADEPTANLDSSTARSILELMKKLNEERKTTFVFSTHDPGVQAFAREKVRLVDGRVSAG